MVSQPNKDNLRGGYKAFLTSPAGEDLLRQMEILEKAYVLQSIKGQTAEEKAFAICRLEGLVGIRDYMVRLSKPSK